MKTTARTALLGLLVSASLQTLAWAGDPNPTAANPFAPDSAPSPLTSQGAFAQAPQPAAGGQPTVGHVSFDSQPAEPAPPALPQSNGGSGGSSSPPGQVSYDSMANQPTWNNPFGVGDGPFGPTFFLNVDAGRGVGWDQTSYQADLYYPWHIVPGKSAIFGLLQGGVDDFGRCYATGGLGYREYNGDFNRIQGFWGFVDYDNTHDFGFTRYGLSYENLGKYFDFRVNGYLLNNNTEYTIGQGQFGEPFFRANEILLSHFRTAEAAYDGFDIELGGPLPFLGRHGVNAYVGPYWVHSDHAGEGVGVQGRINIAVSDTLQVNVQVQEDPVFNSTAFVNVSWALPDGIPTKWFSPTAVVDRLNSMVWRKDRIPVNEITDISSSPLLNPGTGAPIDVLHVNPNLPAGSGNGTAEHPFGDLEQARLADNPNVNIILVQPRNDGTGTNLAVTQSFQLFNDQNVLGTTTQHQITTLEGNFLLPGFTPGSLPLVSNANNHPGTDVFELANRDQISGFEITGANASNTSFGNGIGNPIGPIVGFNINQNQFINYLNAVQLENATGTPANNTLGIFANNGSGQIVNNTATGMAGVSQNGFEVINSNPSNNPSTLDLTVTGNTSTGNAGNGFLTQTNDASQTINAVYTNNTATANGTGFQFTTAPGTINLVFDDNVASANIAPTTGVHVEAEGGTINVTSFESNTVSGNLGNGVWFDANSIVGGGTINVTNFQGNTITNNGTSGIPVIGSDPDGLLISANGPFATVNAQIGVEGGLPNNISNNGSPGVGGAGIHVFVTNEGTVTGSIVNNVIDSNVEYGINFDANAGQIGLVGAPPNMAGAQPFVVDSNTINANGNAGIFARLQSDLVTGSSAGLVITNNSITNQTAGITTGLNVFAHGDGIHIRTEGNSFLWDLDIENNFIGINSAGSAGPNLGSGIFIETFSNSMLTDTTRFTSVPTPNDALVIIQGNQIRFNGSGGVANDDDGITFIRNGDSAVNNVDIFNNNISNNVGNGLNLQMEGGSTDITNGGAHLTIDFFIEGNNLSNNGNALARTGSGAFFQSSSDADFRITLGGADGAQNTINGNAADGVSAETQAFSQVEGTWSNNIIEQNGIFGVAFLDADQTGPAFNVTLLSNFIEHNISDGINFQSAPPIPLGGGNSTINIVSNLIKANGGDGINIEPSGSSVVNVNILDNTITGNTLDGVQFTSNQESVINATATGNTITNNGNDGVNMTTQLGTDATDQAPIADGHGLIIATWTDNIISFNSGHGIDILNQWDGEIDANIQGTVNPNTGGPANASNIIDSNGLDGILVQNFADITLSQTDPLNTTLFFNGTFYSVLPQIAPIVRLTVNQTEISGNGLKAVAPDDGDGIFIAAGTSANGFINASVTNNHFSGNANIDFVTQSFVSTATPTITNLFVNTAGSPTISFNFQPDPVARLALTLTGNVGNTIDVTRLGAFYPPNAAVTPTADAFKTIPGTFDDPFIGLGEYQFVGANDTRFRNAQREPGVFNEGGTSLDGGALFIGGIWGTFAHDASATTPDSVGPTPAPTTTTWESNNGIVINAGDYVNAIESIGVRVISSSATTPNDTITITPALGAAPAVGTPFTVTAFEQAGTGQSTFVTDSGPSVNTFNHFATVISDFGSNVNLLGPAVGGTVSNGTFPFSYTWQTFAPGTFGSPFP
jgi:Right handed beta helix region/Inverse autotransporter, beta-domain